MEKKSEVIMELVDPREGFAKTLEGLGERDPRIVVLVNDSVGSSKMEGFAKKFPDRLLNVGIAEQDLVGIAAGLANGGKIPFACGAACFLTARAMEQIKVDMAYSRANVKLCGMTGGLGYGEMGPTHHAIEDLAWMRAIAGLVVIVPADAIETTQAVQAVYEYVGPVYLRLTRLPVPNVNAHGYTFKIGKGTCIRDGKDLTLIANGTMVTVANQAAEVLAVEGIQTRVINMTTLCPLDEEIIIKAARETGRIVTIEEHTVYGGLGGAVAEVVAKHCPVPMRIMGVPGEFAPTGSVKWLFEYFGLTPEGVRKAAHELLEG